MDKKFVSIDILKMCVNKCESKNNWISENCSKNCWIYYDKFFIENEMRTARQFDYSVIFIERIWDTVKKVKKNKTKQKTKKMWIDQTRNKI